MMATDAPPFSQIPQSLADQRVLRDRADLLRRQDEKSEDQSDSLAFVQFRLGLSEHYGVPHRFVEEIFTVEEIVRVPGAPRAIVGLVNRRGDLMSVLDLKQFYHPQGRQRSEAATIIAISGNGLTVGLLADGIDGEGRFHPDALSAPIPSDAAAKLDHVLGLYAGTVAILNVEALLRDLVVAMQAVQPAEESNFESFKGGAS